MTIAVFVDGAGRVRFDDFGPAWDVDLLREDLIINDKDLKNSQTQIGHSRFKPSSMAGPIWKIQGVSMVGYYRSRFSEASKANGRGNHSADRKME